MPLPVNGYNNTFSAFVQFAQSNVDAGNKKAIANVGGPLGGRTIVASTTDGVGFVGNLFRSRWDEVANDNARKLFLNAVTRMFGGRSNIPESVWKAINLQDYGRGAPLTARRILAVKAAVDAHLSAPPDKLDVTVGGRTVTFEKWHYEGLVAAMPEAERPRGLAGRAQLADMIRNTLANRIENGLKILQEVRAGRDSGTRPPPPTSPTSPSRCTRSASRTATSSRTAPSPWPTPTATSPGGSTPRTRSTCASPPTSRPTRR